jgi:predicted amidohydrolase
LAGLFSASNKYSTRPGHLRQVIAYENLLRSTRHCWENKLANFARVEALLHKAGPERGSLVLLPEMFATGFSMNVSATRESPKQETLEFLRNAAQRLGIFLLAGVVTAAKGHKGFNQAAVFSPNGEELARYTKMQPFAPGGEADNYDAGPEPLLFSWQGFTVAPFICYDLRFPEHFRAAARRGAQLFTVVANWPVARIQHWVTLLQARAIENQAYVAGVNRVGHDPKLVYTGRSLIVSPKGEILADAGNDESVISAEVDPAELESYRRDLPFLRDMRAV